MLVRKEFHANLLIKLRFLFLWILSFGIIVLRHPGALFSSQPFAEDGTVFIEGQLHHGILAVVVPYAGYYHLVPRLVAFLGVHSSMGISQGLALVPLVMNILAILIAAFCATLPLWPRFQWLGSDWIRYAMVIAVLILPYSTEVYGDITNIQWWLGFAQVMVAWDILYTQRYPTPTMLVLLFFSSFTGPLSIIPAMSWWILWWTKRWSMKSETLWSFLSVWPGAVIEFWSSLHAPRAAFPPHAAHWLALYLPRAVFSGVFGGQVLPNLSSFITHEGFFLTSLAGIAIAFWIWHAWGTHRNELYSPFGIFIFLVFEIALGAHYWISSYYLPFHVTAGRYAFVPMAFTAICILRGIGLSRPTFSLRYGILVVVASLMLFTDVQHFQIPPYRQYGWANEVRIFRKGGQNNCTIHIPPNLIMSIPCGTSHTG